MTTERKSQQPPAKVSSSEPDPKAEATLNNATTPDAPAKPPLKLPPGVKLDTSGRSFGFVGPPDFHNPKIKRDQDQEPEA